MKGYSKIGFVKRNKSKSMDISDLPSSPLTPKKVKNPISKNTPAKPIIPNNQPAEFQTPKQIKNSAFTHQQSGPKNPEAQEEEEEEEAEEGKGVERFGSVLRRNCSVSSTSSSSNRFSWTVKRPFSLRRSSSVSESYSRIHDQPTFLVSPIDDCEEAIETRSLGPKKQKKGKITRAWKKLFGL